MMMGTSEIMVNAFPAQTTVNNVRALLSVLYVQLDLQLLIINVHNATLAAGDVTQLILHNANFVLIDSTITKEIVSLVQLDALGVYLKVNVQHVI